MSSESRRGGKARWYLEGDTWPNELAWHELEPGSLEVSGDNLAGVNARRLAPWLERHGALLERLSLESRYLGPDARIDLSAIDWGRLCPNLRRIWLRGFCISPSIFAPAHLEKLHLQECQLITGEALVLAIDSASPGCSVQELTLHQCALPAGLSFASHAALRVFDCRADQGDGAIQCSFAFEACSQLRRIALEFHGDFRLSLSGNLHQLEEVRLDAGAQGQIDLETSELRDCSFALIRQFYC